MKKVLRSSNAPTPTIQAINPNSKIKVKKLLVDTAVPEIRYEKFIQNSLKITRNIARLKIMSGLITVDRFKKTPVYNHTPTSILLPGDVVSIHPPMIAKESSKSGKAGFEEIYQRELKTLLSRIIYKDERILVIDKPARLAVQGGTKTDMHVEEFLKDLAFDNDELPRIVHSLEKGVSGLLVLARSRNVATELEQRFKSNRDITRTFHAILAQPVSTQDVKDSPYVDAPSFDIKGNAGEEQEEGKKDLITSGIVLIGKQPFEKMSVIEYHPSFENVRYEDENPVRKAVTQFKLLSNSPMGAFIELTPYTNRTHQLRLHCSKVLKAPVLGDFKYGQGCPLHLNEYFQNPKKIHLHLHASRVVIKDWYEKGSDLSLSCKLPDYISWLKSKMKL